MTSPAAHSQSATGWRAALHLGTLFNFAVAQPVYDRLTERLAFCRDLNLPAWVVYTLVLVLSLGGPLLLWAIVAFSRWCGVIAARVVLTVLQSILWCLLALPLLKSPGFLSALSISIGAIVLAVAATWGYWKSATFRSVLTLSAIGVPLFPALFLMRYAAAQDARFATAERLSNHTSAPVVMLVFDEFCGLSLMTPERQIDAARFPHFAALARDGHWFRNTASVNELTMQAVPAILSGRHPESEWIMSLHERPQNLFSMLIGTGGYDYAIFEPVSRLAPEALNPNQSTDDLLRVRIPVFLSALARVYLHHLVPAMQTHCLPEVPKLWFGVRTDIDIDPAATRGTFRYAWNVQRDEQFAHFLHTFDGDDTPTLHFMHCLLPHVPWSYLPSGRRYTNDGANWELEQLGNPSDGWTGDELQSTQGQQRYLLQLMYADRLLGQTIDKLRETGLYDKSLIIVTADHGISFRPNQFRRATSLGNRDEIQSVPLFIKRPGEVAGEIHDQPVEAVDILPTMADVLGYRLTLPVDGRSVFQPQDPPRTHRRYGVAYENKSAPVEEIANSSAPRELFTRFGSGSDPANLYRIGPIPELIGRRTDSLSLTSAPSITIQMSRFGDVWPTDSKLPVPVFYEGQVLGHNPVDHPPVVIAVSINGVIQAVTRTYRYAAGLSQWGALVPEAAFHEGHNDVRCYQLQGQAPDWTLTPCELSIAPQPGR